MRHRWEILADRWIGFGARPDPAAVAAVAGMDPTVVVTGGSSGIGLAIARLFARRGYMVLVVARDRSGLEQAVAGCTVMEAARIAWLSLDITRTDAATVIEAALAARNQYQDVLVNCAGIGLAGPFASDDPDNLGRLIDVNITALTALTRHALPAMCARARGGIINMASLGGYVPGPQQAAYYASKAYVCSLTEAVHAECAGTGVRITVVAPGPVNTGFHAAMGTDTAGYRWLFPAHSPEQVARAAVNGFTLGRRVVTPGVLTTVLAALVMVIPHALSLPILGWLLAPREGGR